MNFDLLNQSVLELLSSRNSLLDAIQQRFLAIEQNRIGRLNASVTPSGEEIKLFWKSRMSFGKTLELLGILSWYLRHSEREQDRLTGFLLYEQGLACCRKLDPNMSCKVLCTFQPWSPEFFARTCSERDWFGNLLPAMKEILDTLKLKSQRQPRARKALRHRGYRDKGSLPEFDSKVRKQEFLKDWSSREQQKEIEERRKLHRDTLELIRGFFE